MTESGCDLDTYQHRLAFMNVIPLGTTGLLTPFLIGSYHEMFTYSASYDKSLKMVHHELTYETSFSYISLIGSINAGIFILNNQLVVLMGLIFVKSIGANLFRLLLTTKYILKIQNQLNLVIICTYSLQSYVVVLIIIS